MFLLPNAVAHFAAVIATMMGAWAGTDPTTVPGADAPAWVPSDLTASYSSSTHVFNWTSANTLRYRSAMQAAATGKGVAEQVVIGDSSSAGYDGTVYDAHDSWPSVYDVDQIPHGVPTAGTGWVRSANASGDDARWSFDANWTDVSLFRYTWTSGAVATYTEPMAGTVVALRYSTYAGASFSVSVDGATSGPGFTTVSTPSAATYETVTLSGLPDQAHTVTVTSLSNIFVAVVAASVSTGSSGVILDNVSQGGARASGTGLMSWVQTSNTSSVGGAWGTPSRYQRTPAAVWIALGGNDVSAGTSPDTVTAAIRTIAAQFPNSDVFLVLEYQANEISTAAWTAYAEALYRTAADLNVPLFDEWAQLGSYPTYAADGYAGDALAHLDAAGYTAIGNWLARVSPFTAPSQRTGERAYADGGKPVSRVPVPR